MNRGTPPTAPNARTGEFTPPGVTSRARANSDSLRGVRSVPPGYQASRHFSLQLLPFFLSEVVYRPPLLPFSSLFLFLFHLFPSHLSSLFFLFSFFFLVSLLFFFLFSPFPPCLESAAGALPTLLPAFSLLFFFLFSLFFFFSFFFLLSFLFHSQSFAGSLPLSPLRPSSHCGSPRGPPLRPPPFPFFSRAPASRGPSPPALWARFLLSLPVLQVCSSASLTRPPPPSPLSPSPPSLPPSPPLSRLPFFLFFFFLFFFFFSFFFFFFFFSLLLFLLFF